MERALRAPRGKPVPPLWAGWAVGVTELVVVAAVPLVIAAGLWASERPVRWLAIYAAVMPFGSAFALPLGLPRSFTTLSSLAGGIAMIGLLVHAWRRHRWNGWLPVSLVLWLLVLAYSAISVVWSLSPSGTIDEVFVLASLIALYGVVALYPFEPGDLAVIQNGIVLGTAATGLYGLLLAVSGRLQRTAAGLARFEVTGGGGGEGGDPNVTAAALLLGFAVALAASLNPERPLPSRLAYTAAAAVTGMGVYLTASRGGILAAGVIVLMMLATHRRGLATVGALIVLTVPGLFLISDTLAERIDNTGTSGRTAIWAIGLEQCPQYCAMGAGLGTFADVHEQGFLSLPSATGSRFRFQAHSVWIQWLVEIGIIGTALAVAALAAQVWQLARVPAAHRGGALAALIGLLITSSFLSSATFKYFWLVLIYGQIVVTVNRRDVRVEQVPTPV